MQITSSAFLSNQQIPERYTCNGEGVHPPLSISDYPVNSERFALIVDDPDAPDGTFTHWLVWDITLEHTTIQEGEIPPGLQQGKNSLGEIGYTPPCPPPGHGIHHYRFTIYALKEPLNISEGASRQQFDQALNNKVIDQAELIGLYGR